MSQEQTEQETIVVCLCGSTRFIDQFATAAWVLELRGCIVLGCTLLPTWFCGVRSHFAEATGTKEQRDWHHQRKIDLADEVLVLDIGGYIGESTRNEIAYADARGKPVRYVTDDPQLLAAILPSEQTEQETLICVQGHRAKRTGCVSCELLYGHSSLTGDVNQQQPTRDVASSCAHCASLEQQVADLTKERDTQGADFARQFQTMAKTIEGRDAQLAEMTRAFTKTEALAQRRGARIEEQQTEIDAAEAQLVKMREQLRKLPRYWSRVATTPQVRSVQSVLWVDVERVLSALLDPQDQP